MPEQHAILGGKLAPVNDTFLVVDYFKSDMSEYDQKCVFVPLDYLQRLRALEDHVTSIQIRLKDERDRAEVKKRLIALFPPSPTYHVVTWEDKQSALLQAIDDFLDTLYVDVVHRGIDPAGQQLNRD